MNALGRHILVEFSDCNSEVLNDVAIIEKSMIEAAQIAGATVINSNFHHFSPFGVSGVVVIQESHLAIHTWPEYRYAAVDLFTCGETVDPWVSFEHLKQAFQAEYSALEMNRGSLHLIKKSEYKLRQGAGSAQHPERGTMPYASKPPSASSGEAQTGSAISPTGQASDYKIERNVWFTDKDENQALSLRYQGDLLFNEKSEFQQVRVFETCSYGKMLAINNMVMCTERDEFHYHEMIAHPIMQSHLKAKKILVIGGGDGGTIRELFKYEQVESITMVEIDEAVVRAAKLHLPTLAAEFSNPKLNLIIGDGIDFVHKAKSEEYDVIVVDGSDPVGPAEGLFSVEFFKNCHRALKADGVMITQGESPMFHTNAFVELNQCLKNIFGEKRAKAMLFHAPTYPSGMWSLQLAAKSDRKLEVPQDPKFAQDFVKQRKLQYYNEQLHSAAFALPNFVKKLLGELD